MGEASDVPRDRTLADTVRELIRLARSSTVDDATRADALTHLRAATELLGADQFGGPFWITGETAIDRFRENRDLQALAVFSPAIGPANPVSPGDMTVEVDDDDHVHASVTLSETYNGPPFDHTHGGIVAMIYDDLVGLAAMLGAGGGMTARLTINYRRPTPLFRRIDIHTWYDRTEGRKLFAKGEMHCDGELLSDAEGLFVRPASFPGGIPTT